MALKVSEVYKSLDRDIARFECLSHVCKRLKTNLSKDQAKILKSSKSEKALEKKKLQREDNLTSKQIDSIVNLKFAGTLIRDSTTRQ